MKSIKRIIALLLTAVMTMTMSVTAFAAEPSCSLTVNVKGGQESGLDLKGQTINLYKLFDVTTSQSGNKTNYAYTVNDTYKATLAATLNLGNTATNEALVEKVSGLDKTSVQKFANDFTAKALTSSLAATATSGKIKDSSQSYTFNNLATGYYLVYLKCGKEIQSSLVTVEKATNTINLKTEAPSITKTADKATVNIGDVVNYSYSPFEYTGLAQYGNEWHYIENGKVNWNYTGLAQHGNEWFYIEKGKLNWDYSGIVEYNNQWFYVERGRLNWNYTGLGQSGNDWYYIVRGRVNWGYTGLVQRGNEWFYIENGKLNWNHSGIVEYNKQWFYVERGRLNWNYTGLGQSGNNWYYIERGRVNWGYTGLVQKGNEWFYVKGGKLDWSYTGLVQKGNEWFFVRNGRLDWGYTGLACNGEYYFYVKNGRLDWNYSGYAQIDGQGEYYEVRNGRLVGGTLTLAKMHGVANNQDSPTNYIVIVDRAAHRVGVFKGSKYNWADAKYYKCCVGKPSTPTISGTYYIKSRGKYFDTGTKGRCWYFTQINGNYLFHSVIYDRQNSPKRIIDNSMDAAVSHGCVRLDLENAKWIYDNIPKNTKVIIY